MRVNSRLVAVVAAAVVPLCLATGARADGPPIPLGPVTAATVAQLQARASALDDAAAQAARDAATAGVAHDQA